MLNFLPRLCFLRLNDCLLCGHGCEVEVIYESSKDSHIFTVFKEERSHVYGMQEELRGEGIFLFGDKNLAYVRTGSLFETGFCVPLNFVRRFEDSILAIAPLNGSKIAVLFTCNTMALFEFDPLFNGIKLDEECTVQSTHLAVLMQALLVGRTWSELKSIVGTVFGDILISIPSRGPEVLQKFTGHTGMIFGLQLVDDYLFSISDDRSLRVWNIQEGQPSSSELACEYGHPARPFAICYDGSSFLYTAGVDQMVCQWQFSENSGLQLIQRFSFSFGGIRSLTWSDNHLYIGSENGGLIRFNPLRAINNGLEEITTCEGLRGFANIGKKLFCVDKKGRLYCDRKAIHTDRILRYLVSSHPFHESVVCAYGESDLVMFSPHYEKSGSDSMCKCLDCKIVSVVCTGEFVLAYTVDKNALFYCVKSDSSSKFDCSFALRKLHKTTQFVPTSLAVLKDKLNGDVDVVIVGSTSGHILIGRICPDQKMSHIPVFDSFHEVNSAFDSSQVNALKIDGNILYALGKNGKMSIFRIREMSSLENILLLISSGKVSDAVDMDIPCTFIEWKGEDYVAGFHATDFLLIKLRSRLCVMRIPCGGGNRPWNLDIHTCESGSAIGQLRYVKDEAQLGLGNELDMSDFDGVAKDIDINIKELHIASSEFIEFEVLVDPPHHSQILCARTVPLECDDRQSEKVICSIGLDNQLVFSKRSDKTFTVLKRMIDSAGWICVDFIRMNSSLLMITGSGKGFIRLWKVYPEDLLNSPPLAVERLDSYEHHSGTRILDVTSALVSSSRVLVAAAVADGTIIVLSVICSEGDRFNSSFSLSESFSILAPDCSLYTKVIFLGNKESASLAAVSTSGKLHLFGGATTDSFQEERKIQAASSGICAFDFYENITKQNRFFALGTDSGDCVIVSQNLFDNSLMVVTSIRYHAATSTVIKWTENSENQKGHDLITSSLDCRLVRHRFLEESGEATFIAAKLLTIWDPTDISFAGNEAVVVGSCMEWLEVP